MPNVDPLKCLGCLTEEQPPADGSGRDVRHEPSLCKKLSFMGIDLAHGERWKSTATAQSGKVTVETLCEAWELMKALPPVPRPRIVSPAWWVRMGEEHRGIFHDEECNERWCTEQWFDVWTGCTCSVLYGALLGRS